jgi:hypothetical protein
MPAINRPLSDYSARSVESGTEHFWLFSAFDKKMSVSQGRFLAEMQGRQPSGARENSERLWLFLRCFPLFRLADPVIPKQPRPADKTARRY